MSLKIKCPQCKKNIKWDNNQWRPFCSERCKMIDLGTWAKEEYSISEDSDHVTIEKYNNDEEIV